MIVRSLAACIVAALTMSALSGCSSQPITCTFNAVDFAPTATTVRSVPMREFRADVSIDHMGTNRLSGLKLNIYDTRLKRNLGGPPPSARRVFLPEGHTLRLTIAAVLASGQRLACGTKTVTVPSSRSLAPFASLSPTPRSV